MRTHLAGPATKLLVRLSCHQSLYLSAPCRVLLDSLASILVRPDPTLVEIYSLAVGWVSELPRWSTAEC